ncbi:MAG: hypothetical protein F6K26_25355 [Moorea sp. SIO2I5]|nr:hypothetical protein [Moorena sp. SIO2I5]
MSEKSDPFTDNCGEVYGLLSKDSNPCRNCDNFVPYSLFPTPYSLLPTPYSLLPTPYSLLPTPYSLQNNQ